MAKITNEEKYKTAVERVKAFKAFCDAHKCESCEVGKIERTCGSASCTLIWLALEAEAEKLEPCPFCGCETEIAVEISGDVVKCKCGYHTMFCDTIEMAVAAHNRVARAVRAAERRNEMSEKKKYTAQEMREQAHDIDDVVVPSFNIHDVGAMLRQAADDAEELAKLKVRLEAVTKECEKQYWTDVESEYVCEEHNKSVDAILRAARGESESKNR